MSNLSGIINTQSIIDRFAEYIRNPANERIVWGTNSKPFPEMPTARFGGTTDGRQMSISASSISATPITASKIYSVLVEETRQYTRIRKLRAVLNVSGKGKEVSTGTLLTGSRAKPGIVFDETQVANMSTDYRRSIGIPSNSGVASGQLISASGLESFFNTLKTAYENASVNSTLTQEISVCHSSCHNNCHNSRSRR